MRPAVLAFVIAVSAAVTFFLTLLPAWRTLRPGLLRDLQGVGRSTAGRSLRFAGRLLVVAQLTLTVVLLACAGWMIGGVYLLLHQPLGFAPDHLLMLEAELGFGQFDEARSPAIGTEVEPDGRRACVNCRAWCPSL